MDGMLGCTLKENTTAFKVWAPARDRIELLVYSDSVTNSRKAFPMIKDEEGYHRAYLEGSYEGYFYTYLVDGEHEVTDPYSISSSVNSRRSAIIDITKTNPKGWEGHNIPKAKPLVEEIIYELHIKDFTYSQNSGVKHRGKYLGLVERGCSCLGYSTGIDHLVELGVSCVHLMPVYDYITVDEREESFHNPSNYNWGYDPELYNVPEGSYSSVPADPYNRIIELKTAIMELHNAGIKVVLDVVYNHTYKTLDSNFNILAPKYYHRTNRDGSFSNGSGCGNEIATEKPMMREFLITSLVYWATEYRVDGFRFDLLSLMDKQTFELILKELRKVNPNIIVYGEPWTGGDSSLPFQNRVGKGSELGFEIGLFNDEYRDALKGDNDGDFPGFSQGNINFRLASERGIKGGYLQYPGGSINYVNAHDNLILYDKLKRTLPLASHGEIETHSKFALSILLLSQGVPFFHAGNEFLRTKFMDHNSYSSSIEINQIDWALKSKNIDHYKYVRDLIKLRGNYKLSLKSFEEIEMRIKLMDLRDIGNIIAYTFALNDKGSEQLLIIHNGNNRYRDLSLDCIKAHIKHWWFCEDFKLNLILNDDGLISPIEVKTRGITVPRRSTRVLHIKEMQNAT